MLNIKDSLLCIFQKAFASNYNVLINDTFFVTHSGNHNIDYNCQLIKFQKYLETLGIKLSCQELFNILISEINPEHFSTTFERNSVNINLTPKLICKLMVPVFNNHIMDKNYNVLNILVDFSSPNIAKDMHVGHLRSTIIGDSICKLYELQGHNVHRINHIGDFGLQFGMIIEHLLEKYPNYEDANLTIENLQILYAESKKRFDNEPNFKKNAYQKVIQLQSNDIDTVNAWEYIKKVSRQAYNDIYERLNVNLIECGESFYQNMIPSLIEELQNKGILIDDEGRKIIKLDEFELPLTVVKSDGGYTYDTTDLAAIKYRLVDLNMDTVIYVVDEGQSLHFELIFKVAHVMGWKKKGQELKHVGFGLVQDIHGKKYQSRNGNTKKLKELLDESLIIAEKVFNEARKDTSDNIPENEKQMIVKNVAYASIKYADLSTLRTNNYKFSIEKMVSLKGNTGVYNLYEYVRICAIIKNAGVYIVDINNFNITEKQEITLCKQILLFPEIIKTASESLMFHGICTYLYNLTGIFSSFHANCRCLQFDSDKKLTHVNSNRLLICEATKLILEKCFNILGISVLERM